MRGWKFIAAQNSDEDLCNADGNILLDICMSIVCVQAKRGPAHRDGHIMWRLAGLFSYELNGMNARNYTYLMDKSHRGVSPKYTYIQHHS